MPACCIALRRRTCLRLVLKKHTNPESSSLTLPWNFPNSSCSQRPKQLALQLQQALKQQLPAYAIFAPPLYFLAWGKQLDACLPKHHNKTIFAASRRANILNNIHEYKAPKYRYPGPNLRSYFQSTSHCDHIARFIISLSVHLYIHFPLRALTPYTSSYHNQQWLAEKANRPAERAPGARQQLMAPRNNRAIRLAPVCR